MCTCVSLYSVAGGVSRERNEAVGICEGAGTERERERGERNGNRKQEGERE